MTLSLRVFCSLISDSARHPCLITYVLQVFSCVKSVPSEDILAELPCRDTPVFSLGFSKNSFSHFVSYSAKQCSQQGAHVTVKKRNDAESMGITAGDFTD